MKKTTIIILVVIAILCAAAVWLFTAGPLASTGTNDAEETEEMEKVAPVGPSFNADSAYAFTKAQCDFGPRDMNSKGHDACEQWIIKQFKRYGCTVTTQKADLKGYDGTTLKSTNIIASYNPGATTRIMLCAHWDCSATDRRSSNSLLTSASISFASTLRTGARRSGARRPMTAVHGPSVRSISPSTCPRASHHATPSYSTWLADRARSSIRKACRSSTPPR